MTLVKWTPITRRPIVNMIDEMDRWMNQAFRRTHFSKTDSWLPPVDVKENDKNYDISLDLPGLNKKDVTIEVTDGILVISGERKSTTEHDDECSYCNEINYGKFSRSFNLPENVNENDIKAKFTNGVLSLTLNKVEPVKPDVKQIEIN
ncbi:MAG: Hsp20/alpha crystallin family protein [Candidatus Marinimicrobia bacterium]|nr:Hsp20/alpha crystallin family protein [Candidatus Neomarinimicrobiota bacterium]MBL7022522.1 Hsp20/alpha crystallin family protein [Candidatus Neomarinimicrobiota bacterium]MBL7108623.1 Hsp20/alpha crystallin family protein [Candidatus Neomarinimicrobiota bacterium]